MVLSSNKLVSSLCTGTTLFFAIVWVGLTPVEADIADDINWFENTLKVVHDFLSPRRYIFTKLRLLQMKNYHVIFKYFSYTTLLLIIPVYKSLLQHSVHLKRLAKVK